MTFHFTLDEYRSSSSSPLFSNSIEIKLTIEQSDNKQQVCIPLHPFKVTALLNVTENSISAFLSC